jgi:hypothetical protein
VNHPACETGKTMARPFDLRVRCRLVGAVSPVVSQHRTRPPQDATNPPLRDAITLAQVLGGRSLLVRAYHFFAMSYSIVLSRRSSTINYLSRSTPSSDSRGRRSVSTSSGSRFSRWRYYAGLPIPCVLQMSDTFSPLASSRCFPSAVSYIRRQLHSPSGECRCR